VTDLPRRWFVVAEDESDAVVACGLVDRFADEPAHGLEDWIRDNIDTYRSWRGDETGTSFILWKYVKARGEALGIRLHGYGNRRLGLEDPEIRRVFTLANRPDAARPAGLLLIRDTDGNSDRRAGYLKSLNAYQAATKDDAERVRILMALAHPEIEAWLLAGVEPLTEDGKSALAKERQSLGFDPRTKAEDLNPKRETTPEGEPVKKSTKRVLDELLAAEGVSRESCWKDAPLDLLRSRGTNTGLVDFFDSIQSDFFASLRAAT
jgi:hypothetical protein